MTNKTLYIIRGLPGSGKSTLANKLAPSASCEADDYFTSQGGEYNFDASKLDNAHTVCKEQVKEHMIVDKEFIAVANTFSQIWEMVPYFLLAVKHDYTINVIECQNEFESTHDVPEHTIDRMRDRWEAFGGIF